MKKNSVLCPHCEKPLSTRMVAEAAAEHRLSMMLHPKDGTRLSADTVGGTMVDMAKLLAACGKDAGVKTVLLVDRVNTQADGAIKIDFIVANAPRRRGEVLAPTAKQVQNAPGKPQKT